MALLSFRGISTPSLPAQGEQRRSSYFNIPRGNSVGNLVLGALDAATILKALDRYPHGCSEQITSRAMPLVWV